MGTQSPSPKRGRSPCPIFGPFLLWPQNGCMHQNTTWYVARPRPRQLCVRWGPSSPSVKGAQPPIFGPHLLRPNGCMDQDVTWYGTRHRPMRLCVALSPKGGRTPKFSAHVYCDQTAGWMKLVLGMVVGLNPGEITCASALPGKTGKHENRIFSLKWCISALPEFSSSLLDFFSLFDSGLVLTLLYDSLNLVINARGCWRHGSGERKSRAPQQLDCVAHTMHMNQCPVSLKEKMSSVMSLIASHIVEIVRYPINAVHY